MKRLPPVSLGGGEVRRRCALVERALLTCPDIPTLTDCEIARLLGVGRWAVRGARRRLEASGRVPEVTVRLNKLGRLVNVSTQLAFRERWSLERSVQRKDETRSCRFEVREQADGHIKGYPIVFNTLSQDLGGFYERILPDAVQFDDDLKADFNHNPNYILGRVRAGTLKATVDARGVAMDVIPPDTTWARDLRASISRGDIDQGSFSFRVLPGGKQITEENGKQIRTLSKILVRRLSVVSDPAYIKTSIEARRLPAVTEACAPDYMAKSVGAAPVSVYWRRQSLTEIE